LCARYTLFAQPAGVDAKPHETNVSVPFVGCTSYGQSDTLEAPVGENRPVPIGARDAEALAYYSSADGIGLLAPRGWYCEGVSGSGGYALFLSPKPIHRDASGWEGLEGPAIEINHMTGENGSGRYEIAQVIARVFPAYRDLLKRFSSGMDLPLAVGPYPKDTLKYRSKMIVEYSTPAQTEGLGNFDSWLGKSDLPIRGAALIVGDPTNAHHRTDLVLLSVRMPQPLSGLVTVIIGQFERDTIDPQRK
jgi:hypothetical protein